MNPQLIDSLAGNLEDEIEVQNGLLEALRNQRARLIEGGADGLEGTTERIRVLLERTDRNRKRRAGILRSLGIDPSSVEPVGEVARGAAPEKGEHLRGLRGILVGISSEVKALNRFNAQLVRRSAELVESLLRVFVGPDKAPGYDLRGTAPRLEAGGVLVNQEV